MFPFSIGEKNHKSGNVTPGGGSSGVGSLKLPPSEPNIDFELDVKVFFNSGKCVLHTKDFSKEEEFLKRYFYDILMLFFFFMLFDCSVSVIKMFEF